MHLIILTSIFVALGSYLLRKVNLIGLFLIIFQKGELTSQELLFTFLGLALNLIGILLWQISVKFNIQFQIAWSMYLSLSLVFGYLIAYIFEKNRLELNFYVGAALVLGGILILTKK